VTHLLLKYAANALEKVAQRKPIMVDVDPIDIFPLLPMLQKKYRLLSSKQPAEAATEKSTKIITVPKDQ